MDYYDALPDNCSNLRGDESETSSIGFDRIEKQKNLLLYAIVKLLLEQMKFTHFAIKAFSTLVALMLPSAVRATDYVQCRELFFPNKQISAHTKHCPVYQ